MDPPIRDPESGLSSIASSPDGAVWTVGWRLAAEGIRPLILRRDADGWQTSPTAAVSHGQAVLTSVDFVSADVGYAAGFEIPKGESVHVPLLIRWDGAAWRRVGLPWARDRSAVIHSVAVAPGEDLLLAGARVAVNSGYTRAMHVRFSEDAWEVLGADVNPYHNSELLDGDFLPRGATVVGGHAGDTMAFTACTTVSSARWAERTALSEDETPTRGQTERARQRESRGRRLSRGAAVRFVDVARRTGLYDVTETWDGVSADFDGNGWPDVFYSRHNLLNGRLMLGGPRGFRLSRHGKYRDRDRHGCAAGDVDRDGIADLFCAHGADRGSKMKSNELWLRPGTREGRQVTADFGVVDPFGRGRAATFLHLDADEYPDLFVTNAPERVDGMPSLNRLYRNVRGTRFVSAAELGADSSMGGLCAVAGDIDADGDEDLLVCASEPWGGLPRGLRVFRNDGGTFRHATRAMGLEPIGDQDVVVADLDGDGRADDVAQLGTGGLRVSIGGPDGRRSVFQLTVSGGVAIGAGDANGDGLADLYVVRGGRGNPPDLMLMNHRRGRAYRSVRIPQATFGLADDVVVLDHDRNGLDDFLVLNGRGAPGPIQLIASFARP
jgi:hypothetical protein